MLWKMTLINLQKLTQIRSIFVIQLTHKEIR